MDILLFNWRDIKNPRAGGAERVTHKILEYLVQKGHTATLFCASFTGASETEVINGVNIIRRGSQWSVHLFSFWFYLKQFKGNFDLVIDEINTIPFFTPLYIKEKKLAYINQLAKEVWLYESKFPISWLGFFLEPLYLKLYSNTQTITICDSCKKELEGIGFRKVQVIPMAVDFEEEQKFIKKKFSEYSLIFVGRLVPSKKVLDCVEALWIAKSQIPNLKLRIIGSGDQSYISKLKHRIKELDLEKNVEFKGRISQEEKYSLMSSSHLILVSSVKEGWGLIVTEANAVKTPAIVYDVTGLRDAVKNNVTGIVCKENTPQELARNIIDLFNNHLKYQELQKNAYDWSKNLTWDNTCKRALEIIEKVANE